MEEQKLIFLKGIENLLYIRNNKRTSIFESVKILCFYILLCILAKYQKPRSNLFFINGHAEAKRNNLVNSNYNRIYARRFSSSCSDLIEMYSVVSTLSRKKRLKVIFKAIFNNPADGGNLGRWIEYCLLSKMLEKNQISRAASYGHYDEFTFWLSELCRKREIYYTMYQHGVVSGKWMVPNRINCNKIHVYNKFSENVFRNTIIKNSNCQYIIDGLHSSVQFSQIKKCEGKKYIGIIDQNLPEWTRQIARSILKINNYVAVIMKHPLSKQNYCGIEKNTSIICTQEKYDNLDCIVTEYSTLVLDYLSVNYSMPIICTNEEAVKGMFSEYDLVYVNKKDLKKVLPNILNS